MKKGLNMRLHHVGLVSSSRGNADRFYMDILGLEKIKTATLEKDLMEQIFGIQSGCEVITYGSENILIEVFLGPDLQGEISGPGHLCLQIGDRERFMATCESAGLSVKRVPKGESLVTFVEDFDGNLIEVKAKD